jgi:hypothetical protein
VSQFRADITWPFYGRIWRHRQDCPPLVVLNGPGLQITIDWLLWVRDGTLRTVTGTNLNAARVLGSGYAPDFLTGDGKPLFEWIMREVPPVWHQPSRQGGHYVQGGISAQDMRCFLRALLDTMTARRVNVLYKPWPFGPGTEYRQLRADEFGFLHIAPAIGFARFIGAAATILCDLRWVPVVATAAVTERPSPPAPEPPPPPNEPSEPGATRAEKRRKLVSVSIDLIEHEDQRRLAARPPQPRMQPHEAQEWLKDNHPRMPMPAADSIRRRRNRPH